MIRAILLALLWLVIALAIAAGIAWGAPAPPPKRAAPARPGLAGEYAVTWGGVAGTLSLRPDGSHEHLHGEAQGGVRYVGTWRYDPAERVLHFEERMIWDAHDEVREVAFGEGLAGKYHGVDVVLQKR